MRETAKALANLEKRAHSNAHSMSATFLPFALVDKDLAMFEVDVGLEFTKRGGRLGLKDNAGNPVRSFKIHHNKDGIVREKCKGAMANANKGSAKAIQGVEMVREYIVKNKTVSGSSLRTWAERLKKG